MLVRITFIALIIHLSFLKSYSQDLFYETYDWEKSPQIHTLSPDDQKYPAVVIKDYKIVELIIDSYGADSYTTVHCVVHVNSNAGIEKFNKVAVPVQTSQELLSLQVRSIGPDGNVTLFQQENLKELKNVNGFNNFKIFAIEGLTLGGELEYLYTLKTRPKTLGREVFQRDVPVKEAEFAIISSGLKWDVKTYNGLQAAKETPMGKKKKLLSVNAANIPALKEEQYSAYKANLMRLEYSLAERGGTTVSMTWESLSKQLLNMIYNDDALDPILKMIDQLHLEDKGEVEKIISLENYIKTNFTVKNGSDDSFENLKDIVKKHVGNQRGMAKLYMRCFKILNIPNELVLANNRFESKIDRDFASYYPLNDFLFYFPKHKKYIAPGVSYYRFGAAPTEVGSGLFITYAFSSTGRVLSMINYSIRAIEPLDYTHNHLGIKATLSFPNNIDMPQVDQENYYQGYRAFNDRGAYALTITEKKNDYLQAITLSGIENPTIIKRKVEGSDLSLSVDPDAYFTVHTTYTSASLVEKAGDDYLISVGKLIGRQSELYQETARQTDIEFRAIANYHHELKVPIPDKYEFNGLDKLKTSSSVTVNQDKVMSFESSYEIKDGQLVITIDEIYKVLSLPKSKYDEFRSVVNASADFNKVVVILTPKK